MNTRPEIEDIPIFFKALFRVNENSKDIVGVIKLDDILTCRGEGYDLLCGK